MSSPARAAVFDWLADNGVIASDICTQTMTSWQSVSKAELLRPPRTESGSNDGEEADVTVTQIDDTVSGDMDVDQTVTMESGPKLDASIYLQHPSR